MKTVLIFGSTGSLGHALVKKFLENGFFVIGISKSQDFFKNDNYCFLLLDVLKHQDYSNLLNICVGKDIEFCINTIGCYSNKFLQDLGKYRCVVLEKKDRL